MDTRFSNQIAIVTGGAMGLGKAVTTRIAKEKAKVYIFDISKEAMLACTKELRAAGLDVDSLEVDVTNEASVQAALAEVLAKEGKVDVLAHCAAIVGPNNTKCVDISVEEFKKVIDINFTASFIVCKQAIKVMLPKNYGRILLFASIAGKEGNAGMCPYSATKAAVIGLTKSIGKEYAETGITINAIAPAVIRTPMVASMHPDQVKYMTDKIPMKRCGELEEVASLASWVLSKEASFNTGFCFDLTGGRAVY